MPKACTEFSRGSASIASANPRLFENKRISTPAWCEESSHPFQGAIFAGYRCPGGTREKHAYHRLNSLHASGVPLPKTSALQFQTPGAFIPDPFTSVRAYSPIFP
jgi:hypothetical protein